MSGQNPKHTEKQHGRHREEIRKCIVEWGTLVGIWFAAFVAIHAIHTASTDARGQRDVMAGQLHQMELEQRAWVSVEATIDGGLQFLPNGAAIGLKFGLKNSGKSPATRAWVWAHIFAVYDRALYDPDKRLKICRDGDPPGSVGETVFPNDAVPEIDEVVTSYDLAPAEKFIKGKPADLVVVGCVKYLNGDSPQWHYTGILGILGTQDASGVWHNQFDPAISIYPQEKMRWINSPFGHYAE